MNWLDEQTDTTPVVRRTLGESPLSLAVVQAVAAANSETAHSLDPLGEVVDPEALEAVLDGAGGMVHITFTYADRRVVVTDEAIEVY